MFSPPGRNLNCAPFLSAQADGNGEFRLLIDSVFQTRRLPRRVIVAQSRGYETSPERSKESSSTTPSSSPSPFRQPRDERKVAALEGRRRFSVPAGGRFRYRSAALTAASGAAVIAPQQVQQPPGRSGPWTQVMKRQGRRMSSDHAARAHSLLSASHLRRESNEPSWTPITRQARFRYPKQSPSLQRRPGSAVPQALSRTGLVVSRECSERRDVVADAVSVGAPGFPHQRKPFFILQGEEDEDYYEAGDGGNENEMNMASGGETPSQYDIDGQFDWEEMGSYLRSRIAEHHQHLAGSIDARQLADVAAKLQQPPVFAAAAATAVSTAAPVAHVPVAVAAKPALSSQTASPPASATPAPSLTATRVVATVARKAARAPVAVAPPPASSRRSSASAAGFADAHPPAAVPTAAAADPKQRERQVAAMECKAAEKPAFGYNPRALSRLASLSLSRSAPPSPTSRPSHANSRAHSAPSLPASPTRAPPPPSSPANAPAAVTLYTVTPSAGATSPATPLASHSAPVNSSPSAPVAVATEAGAAAAGTRASKYTSSSFPLAPSSSQSQPAAAVGAGVAAAADEPSPDASVQAELSVLVSSGRQLMSSRARSLHARIHGMVTDAFDGAEGEEELEVEERRGGGVVVNDRRLGTSEQAGRAASGSSGSNSGMMTTTTGAITASPFKTAHAVSSSSSLSGTRRAVSNLPQHLLAIIASAVATILARLRSLLPSLHPLGLPPLTSPRHPNYSPSSSAPGASAKPEPQLRQAASRQGSATTTSNDSITNGSSGSSGSSESSSRNGGSSSAISPPWSWEEWLVSAGLVVAVVGVCLSVLSAPSTSVPTVGAVMGGVHGSYASGGVTVGGVTTGRGGAAGKSGTLQVQVLESMPYHMKEAQPGVLELTASSLPKIVSIRPTFVMFYAPWCPYCQRMEAAWKALAVKLHEENFNVQVARVDAYKYPELASRYKIQGFPTLMLFESGEPVGVHKGRRTLDALFSFVDKFFPN